RPSSPSGVTRYTNDQQQDHHARQQREERTGVMRSRAIVLTALAALVFGACGSSASPAPSLSPQSPAAPNAAPSGTPHSAEAPTAAASPTPLTPDPAAAAPPDAAP